MNSEASAVSAGSGSSASSGNSVAYSGSNGSYSSSLGTTPESDSPMSSGAQSDSTTAYSIQAPDSVTGAVPVGATCRPRPSTDFVAASYKPSELNYFLNNWIPSHQIDFSLFLFSIGFSVMGIGWAITDQLGSALGAVVGSSSIDILAVANDLWSGNLAPVASAILTLCVDSLGTVLSSLSLLQYVYFGTTIIGDVLTAGTVAAVLTAASLAYSSYELYQTVNAAYTQAYP